MRKVLMLTAAVLVAVIFFLLVTLPPSPRTIAWAGDPTLARRTVAGAYHVHTSRSDGAGSKPDVAAAAARAGLQFVILTDHGDGTRASDPPEYLEGVLCVDAVEISTNGGHYVALGMSPAPYPLGGESDAVIEDVARLGGFGVVAHPDSVRPELAWKDWSAGFDGVEWLNADSEWRKEPAARLARVLFDYLIRPGPALASILKRPSATLGRWDTMISRRPVIALAGQDAHGGIGRTTEPGRRISTPGIPSYAASFQSFSTKVILDAPPSGEPVGDGRALLDAIRRGRVFTAIDAIASPAVLDFHVARDGVPSSMGSVLPPGPATLTVDAALPPGARIVLLHDGVEEASGGRPLRRDVSLAQGAYRVEVQMQGRGAATPIPWLLSNPIYFLSPLPPVAAPVPESLVPLPLDTSWHVESDRGSTGSVVPSATEVAFYYRLRSGARRSQFAALVADIQGRGNGFDRLRFTAQAGRPVRISVQIRALDRGGLRWGRSIYLDTTPRDFTIALGAMLPADRQTSPAPPLASAASLLFVADLTNARPGDANAIRISNAGFGR
jgi:hypothetical protein